MPLQSLTAALVTDSGSKVYGMFSYPSAKMLSKNGMKSCGLWRRSRCRTDAGYASHVMMAKARAEQQLKLNFPCQRTSHP